VVAGGDGWLVITEDGEEAAVEVGAVAVPVPVPVPVAVSVALCVGERCGVAVCEGCGVEVATG
jgi:hypothetical protein